MRYNKLNSTDIDVSEICLGSMTWGTRNSEADGHQQISYALHRGVNFIDTAETYPVTPMNRENAGRTEEIIGTWIQRNGRRDELVLATKIAGINSTAVRDGAPISGKSIKIAVESSLRRLKTDYIDLYQLHWPNRGSYHFRRSWHYDVAKQDGQRTRDEICDCLRTFEQLLEAGKVLAVGLSNETCWGTAQYMEISRRENLPKVATTQNEYSLLDRKFDLDFAELAHNENVGLLAFSPLAAGILSGKYQGDKTPPLSRRSFSKDLGGRYTKEVIPVVDEYLKVAARHGIDACQMAIAFCISRPFMTSTIIGATSIEQLDNALRAADLRLDESVMSDIAAVHRKFSNPMG